MIINFLKFIEIHKTLYLLHNTPTAPMLRIKSSISIVSNYKSKPLNYSLIQIDTNYPRYT